MVGDPLEPEQQLLDGMARQLGPVAGKPGAEAGEERIVLGRGGCGAQGRALHQLALQRRGEAQAEEPDERQLKLNVAFSSSVNTHSESISKP